MQRGVALTTAATHSNGAGLKNPMIRVGKKWVYGNMVEARYMFRLGSSPTLGSAGNTFAFDLPSNMFGSIGNTADLIGYATLGINYFQHVNCNVHLTSTTTPGKGYFVAPGSPIFANNTTYGTTFYAPPGYGDAVASTNVITTGAAHNLSAGNAVWLSPTGASGTWPAGVTAGTTYYVISSGLTSTAFKVSTTAGGSELDITGNGSVFVTKQPAATPISAFNDFHIWVKYETADS